MESSKCNKDIGEINIDSNDFCPESSKDPNTFTSFNFLKENSQIFTIMGVTGTMLALLPNLIDRFLGSDWKHSILLNQSNYSSLVIVELPLIFGAVFFFYLFLAISLKIFENRSNERIINGLLGPIRSGDFERILFGIIYIPLGLFLSLFLLVIPILQNEIVATLLTLFLVFFFFTIFHFYIVCGKKSKENIFLFNIGSILSWLVILAFLLIIPIFTYETEIKFAITFLLLFYILIGIILYSPRYEKQTVTKKNHSKKLVKIFGIIAVVQIILVGILTIYPLIFTPFSDPDTRYGMLYFSSPTRDYSPLNSESIGIKLQPEGSGDFSNITKVGLFHLQYHWSTNYGYFLSQDPKSNLIVYEGQEVKNPYLREKIIYWTYDSQDINRQKPFAIITVHLEDEYIQKPFMSNESVINWTGLDIANLEEKPKKT